MFLEAPNLYEIIDSRKSLSVNKKNYFKVELEKNKNDPCKIWNIIRLLLPSKSKQSLNTQSNDLEKKW